MDDVEMAHDEVATAPTSGAFDHLLTLPQIFSGPMSESVPTSVTSFAHRRHRSHSVASFTYLQPADDEPTGAISDDQELAIDDEEDMANYDGTYEDEDDERSLDLESGELSLRRISSTYSRASVHDRLLRNDSQRSESSHMGKGKMSQKIYIVNEDLTIVIAGFVTSRVGYIIYAMLCTFTLGLAFLLLRWLPRWKVGLMGVPSAIRDATWVVIEVCTSLFPAGAFSSVGHLKSGLWAVAYQWHEDRGYQRTLA